MIDFSTLQSLSIPEGVVTQIADASGRVLWNAVREIIAGSLYLRPSADISLGHEPFPHDGIGYLKINEEVSDKSSTYITSEHVLDSVTSTSKFKLSVTGELPDKLLRITSVNIAGESKSSPTSSINAQNDFKLEINGVETSVVTQIDTKDDGNTIDINIPDAIGLINEYVVINGILPDINLIITSHAFKDTSSDKEDEYIDSGVTQVYVVLGYEA